MIDGFVLCCCCRSALVQGAVCSFIFILNGRDWLVRLAQSRRLAVLFVPQGLSASGVETVGVRENFVNGLSGQSLRHCVILSLISLVTVSEARLHSFLEAWALSVELVESIVLPLERAL